MTFKRLGVSDWVVFVAALALLFTTAPDWYSTKIGDEARRIQQEAKPPEGAPSGQAEAEVQREAGVLLPRPTRRTPGRCTARSTA